MKGLELSCSPHGLIILEFIEDADEAAAEFEEKASKIADVCQYR
ncbi:MAG: hypothetical protein WCD89_11150 [Anaerocolumna sp.]